jgi:cytochrome c peroxidase
MNAERATALHWHRRRDGKTAFAVVLTCFVSLVAIVCVSCVKRGRQATAPPPISKDGALAQPRPPDQVGLPFSLTQAAIPPDNPQTPEKIALGRKLFFEGRLSGDGTVACATCHDPERAFTDGRQTSVGIHGRAGQRNSPTVLNALYNKAQFWDGRAKTLEDQASLPIINPIEMGQPSLNAAVEQIAGIEEYRQAFSKVFGRPINGPDLVHAIAAYERTLVSFNSPFDRFIAGDKSAIDDAAQRGWELFNTQARCNKCHALSEAQKDPTLFIDYDFHNIGIGIIRHNVSALARQAEQLIESGNPVAVDRAAIQTEMTALGRFLVTKKEKDTASFKTPGLRNLLMTGPYFHDGSQETLLDVVDHYNKGDGVKDPWLDEDMQPLALHENQIDDLVAFLASLTSDDYKEPAAKELERQRVLSRTTRPQRDTARAFGPKPVQPTPPKP